MTSKTLALLAALAATSAFAKDRTSFMDDPCLKVTMDTKEQCNAACFKVDMNKKDEVPDAKQKACMKGCDAKVMKATTKCNVDREAKRKAAQKKEHNAEDLQM